MTAKTSPTRGTETWFTVVQAYNLCNQRLSEKLATLHVSMAEHDVLMALLYQPGIKQQDIAKRCFVAKSGISMLLAKFEATAIIRREADAQDSRVKRVYLHVKGERLALKTLKLQQETVNKMAAVLTDSELALIKSAMQRVSGALQEINEQIN